MSYILEALKKAEAERYAGATPRSYAAAPAAPLPVARRSARPGLWLWLVLAIPAAGLGTAAWLRPSSGAGASPPIVQASASSVKSEPSEAKTVLLLKHSKETQLDAGPGKEMKGEPSKVKKKETDNKQPPAEASNSTAPIPMLRELPGSMQQQIPELNVGGYIYSTVQSDRSVLINNRLLREGDEAAAGLTLEKMLPDAMVLSYKDYRFRIKY